MSCVCECNESLEEIFPRAGTSPAVRSELDAGVLFQSFNRTMWWHAFCTASLPAGLRPAVKKTRPPCVWLDRIGPRALLPAPWKLFISVLGSVQEWWQTKTFAVCIFFPPPLSTWEQALCSTLCLSDCITIFFFLWNDANKYSGARPQRKFSFRKNVVSALMSDLWHNWHENTNF